MIKLSSAITFAAILLSISLGKYISRYIYSKNREFIPNNTAPVKFDDSLRNYHPNKGE